MKIIIGLMFLIITFLLCSLTFSARQKDDPEDGSPAACKNAFWHCWNVYAVPCDQLKDKYPGGQLAPECKRAKACWKWWEAGCR